MTKEVTFSSDHGLVLLVGHEDAEIPSWVRGASVLKADSCLVIMILHPMDGDTTVMLTDENIAEEIRPDMHLAFAGTLHTRSRFASVYTTSWTLLAKLPVASDETDIEVLTNRHREPSKVWIRIMRQKPEE